MKDVLKEKEEKDLVKNYDNNKYRHEYYIFNIALFKINPTIC